MQRLIIILFLVFGIPISLNAAGIYDNDLMNSDNKKKEKTENMKTDAVYFLKKLGGTASEYEIELISIQKKNTIKHKLQDKLFSYKRFDLADVGASDFTQYISGDDSDPLALFEVDTAWVKIKADLNFTNDFFNKIDSWIYKNINEYISQNRDADLVSFTNIQIINNSNKKFFSYEKSRQSNVVDKRDTQVKPEDYSSITPSSYKDELNNNYSSRDEKNLFSIIDLWKIYSDTIISILSVSMALWLIIARLIKLLTR